jgi:hypothetical protein
MAPVVPANVSGALAAGIVFLLLRFTGDRSASHAQSPSPRAEAAQDSIGQIDGTDTSAWRPITRSSPGVGCETVSPTAVRVANGSAADRHQRGLPSHAAAWRWPTTVPPLDHTYPSRRSVSSVAATSSVGEGGASSLSMLSTNVPTDQWSWTCLLVSTTRLPKLPSIVQTCPR